MNLEDLRKTQKKLISLVLENLDYSALSIFLPFSYLGARICYAESHPLLLFEEEKFKDLERFKSFLLHLKKAGHFSIFAHTPIFVNLKKLSLEEKFALAKTYFKVFFDEDLALFNLRHIAENLSDHDFLHLINVEPSLEKIEILLYRNFQLIYSSTLDTLDSSLFKEENSLWLLPR